NFDLKRGENGPLNFLGASALISSELLPTPARHKAMTGWGLHLYARPGTLERVSWVGRSVSITEEGKRLQYLRTLWKPGETVVLEDTGEGSLSQGEISPDWREDPGRVVARGGGPPGWLVYSGVDFPGWKAEINGRPQKIRRANHAFMAVPTPAGNW